MPNKCCHQHEGRHSVRPGEGASLQGLCINSDWRLDALRQPHSHVTCPAARSKCARGLASRHVQEQPDHRLYFCFRITGPWDLQWHEWVDNKTHAVYWHKNFHLTYAFGVSKMLGFILSKPFAEGYLDGFRWEHGKNPLCQQCGVSSGTWSPVPQ